MVANPLASAEPVVNGKLNVAGVVGTKGELSVTRDLGFGEPYRGVVPLRSGEIAQDLAHYLNESEQTPAAVVLGVHVLREGRVGHAGGFLVQLLPGVSDDEAQELTRRVRDVGAVTSRMAAGEGPTQWLDLLFPEGYQVLETTPASFLCGCSLERVETALKLLGAADIRELVREAGEEPTLLKCEFCKTVYEVGPSRLAELLEEVEQDIGDEPVN
jgi:molecular chaperone Hsp33